MTVVLALMGLVGQGCATPTRTPLPAPFPVTGGGTPVPGKGLGIGLSLGDGLQGQELLRKELLAAHLVAGIADRINLGGAIYAGHDDNDPQGVLLTGKVRLAAPLGPQTSTALHVGVAIVSLEKLEQSTQDESLTALDFALPTELLASTGRPGAMAFSTYVGPRIMYERYRDRIEPGDNLDGWLPGLLGGLHLRLGPIAPFGEGSTVSFDLFGEGTVAWRPETMYRGLSYDGGLIFLPSGGIVASVGSPFRWDR